MPIQNELESEFHNSCWFRLHIFLVPPPIYDTASINFHTIGIGTDTSNLEYNVSQPEISLISTLSSSKAIKI